MKGRAAQKVPQKDLTTLTIRVVRRSDDFHACLEDQPGVWGCGRSVNEAVGDLVRSHTETFGIKLTGDQIHLKGSSVPCQGAAVASGAIQTVIPEEFRFIPLVPTPHIGWTGVWTADMITDAQIRDLLESGNLSTKESADCTHALQKRDRHWTHFQRNVQRGARIRCAQLLYARTMRSP